MLVCTQAFCAAHHSRVLPGAAQLLGLAASVVALQALEAAGSPDTVVPVWMAVHAVHCYLRYAALSSLLFPYPNQASWGCPLSLCWRRKQ